MAKVSMSMDLGVPADKVWDLIGGFNALPDWHPAVGKSEIDGEGHFTFSIEATPQGAPSPKSLARGVITVRR